MLDALTKHRVIPVIVSDRLDTADALGDALVAGGLPIAEVTMRTSAALGIISTLGQRGDIVVGAGTVLRPDDVDRAVDAGARFVVSPVTDLAILARARERGILAIPGAMTPTEVLTAQRSGARLIKLFPAASAGGVAAVAALASVFPDLRFIPTGGITLASVMHYLTLPAVAAVGGSWMVPQAAVEAGDTTAVSALIAQTVAVTARHDLDPSNPQENA